MKSSGADLHNFDLTNLPAIELEKLWRLHFYERVPHHLPKSLLSRLLAYRLQMEQQGGLSKKALAYLKVIEADIRAGKESETPYPTEQKLKVGCQLRREHEGVYHCVIVLDDGYEWEGKSFASLSSVAKAITGNDKEAFSNLWHPKVCSVQNGVPRTVASFFKRLADFFGDVVSAKVQNVGNVLNNDGE